MIDHMTSAPGRPGSPRLGRVARTVAGLPPTSFFAVSAVFVLRRRAPDAARPFRAWGYPWAPATFVAASTLMIANEIWRSPGPSIAGLAIIASGMPVYWWLTRSKI